MEESPFQVGTPEYNQWFLDHLREIAGVDDYRQYQRPVVPVKPPERLSMADLEDKKLFLKWAKEIATNQIPIVP
jgi:hypothetical protein